MESVLQTLNDQHQTLRSRLKQKEKILRNLKMALDELGLVKKASNGRVNKIWFREELKKNYVRKINSLYSNIIMNSIYSLIIFL